MVSIYWLIALFSGIFFWMYCLKRKHGEHQFTEISLVICYFASRVFILTQISELSNGMVFNFFLDLFFLYLLRNYLKRKDAEYVAPGMALYIANPFVIAALLSNHCLRMLLIIVCIVILLLVARLRGFHFQWKNNVKLFYTYIVFSVGGYFYSLAEDVYGFTWKSCDYTDDVRPILLVLGALALLVSYISALEIVFHGTSEAIGEQEAAITTKQTATEQRVTEHTLNETGEDVLADVAARRFTKWDWIWMGVLTALFAVLDFYRIGSFTAPQTTYTYVKEEATEEENTTEGEADDGQILLDFGEETYLSKVSAFLGYKENRRVQITSYNEITGNWDILESEASFQNVFCWNDITIDRIVTKLGIKFLDDEASVEEFVFVDEKYEPVVPVNASEYETLFDEQELYPETSTYYYRTMFDEIYHARTAYETLHGLTIYELSHPPLGKSLMSIGVAIFGMTPFGWRFIVAIFGILLVPVMYAFLRKLTKNTKYAIAGTILLVVEFMHFTLSRIGTIDAIVAFFVLFAFYLMYCFTLTEHEYRYRSTHGLEGTIKCLKQEILLLVLCGITIGLAIATKWTGAYAAVGLAILLFTFIFREYQGIAAWKASFKHLRTLCVTCVVSFLAIPLIIYICAFSPYVRVYNYSMAQMAWLNSIDMLRYHETTVFEHHYASDWYTWAWMKTPLFDSASQYPDGSFSFVATFGNPIIWWGGIAAFFYNIYLWFHKKNRNAEYLCICYLCMLVPWIFIHRTLFIYQYYVPSLILVMMLIHSFSQMKDKKNRKLIGFVATAVVVFVLFYPVISGSAVTRDYLNHVVRWMSSWDFMDWGA